jgi:hypothetical protein
METPEFAGGDGNNGLIYFRYGSVGDSGRRSWEIGFPPNEEPMVPRSPRRNALPAVRGPKLQ